MLNMKPVTCACVSYACTCPCSLSSVTPFVMWYASETPKDYKCRCKEKGRLSACCVHLWDSNFYIALAEIPAPLLLFLFPPPPPDTPFRKGEWGQVLEWQTYRRRSSRVYQPHSRRLSRVLGNHNLPLLPTRLGEISVWLDDQTVQRRPYRHIPAENRSVSYLGGFDLTCDQQQPPP